MRSKQGLSGRISVRAERQALAALLSSSAHVTAYPVWLIDTSNQMSLRVLRGFPRWETAGLAAMTDNSSARSDPSSQMGDCRPARSGRNISQIRCMSAWWCVIAPQWAPAASVLQRCWKTSTLLHQPCKSSCRGFRIRALAASWGQFGLRIAAEQLSKLWKGCHQLSCGTLSTTQMWSNISKRPCEAKKNAPPWNVIHARGVFSYWFLVQTGIQVGVSGIRKQKRWCGVKVCSDGAG